MDPSLPHQTTTITTTTASGGSGYGGDDVGGLKDTTNIVKRKRTKRQRLQSSSSVPFTIVAHSSTSYNTFNSSPASSTDFPAGSTTTEDEDTAKCLILLSKGHNVSLTNNIEEFSSYKFNSKKYIQTSTDDRDGVTGIYVYECKTCSRTFPSFQALGGHRASHKKPRINEIEKRKPPPYNTVFSDEDEPSPPWRKNNSSSSSSLSLQLNHRVYSPGNIKKSSSKLHECSICGTEFNSGQALGGHMRRHRVVNGAVSTAVTATNTTLSLVPYGPVTTMVVDDQDNQKSRNDGLFLDLDLNLPAPPETVVTASHQDQHRESSFNFTANQNKQQPAVHLSATPTLVDCHY